MASFLATTLLAAGLGLGPQDAMPLQAIDYTITGPVLPVSSGGCERAVQQALQETGGELLSVRPAKNVCNITVLVVNAKGRPRKVRLRIPMDN